MKKIRLWALLLVIVLALGACGKPKTPATDPDAGKEFEFELSVETHFSVEREEGDEPLKAYAYLIWRPAEVDYELVEYSGSFAEPSFSQSGTIARPEDDVLHIEREGGGEIELSIPEESNSLSYRITIDGETEELLLSILTEDEAEQLKAA